MAVSEIYLKELTLDPKQHSPLPTVLGRQKDLSLLNRERIREGVSSVHCSWPLCV